MLSGDPLMPSQGNDPSPQAIAQTPLFGILNDVSQKITRTRGDKPNIYLWGDESEDPYYPSTPDSIVDSGE